MHLEHRYACLLSHAQIDAPSSLILCYCQSLYYADTQASLMAQAVSEDAQDRKFIHALLLAWFATPNRSLFPSRCLVETAIEMYQSGLWLQDLQLALSVASKIQACNVGESKHSTVLLI